MKRMLINGTQSEERRLAIVDGQKLLDYEIEIEGREQRKGNIYKAVVTRVEPSLEACFVDYGEDRHGFLPFKEISRQYFADGVPVSQARIQDVIQEGQELLVQVEKEERGNKGAALTTFISLAGRYVVLMPNNPRGGGVSRRIEGEDRAELKEAMDQLEYPNGMSIIARTAGIGRSAPELQWDLNYLLKLWNAIDGAAKGGKGAFLIYQESSLVIRAIRDYFNNDIGDILIDTDDIYEQAQQFMAHVMPEHAARVKRYRDDAALFSRFQIEHQIESAYARTVQLPSGGAIDGVPQLQQVVQVPLQLRRGAADAGGARDDGHAVGVLELVHRLLEFRAVLTLDATRNATASGVVGHQHHVAAGQRDKGGQGSALVAALFFFDLDQQFLAFLDHVVDACLVGRDTRGEVAARNFLERQKAVAVFAVIHKAGFQRRLDARDDGLVDIALALLAPLDFDFVVEELLSVDDGQAPFFGLRGVDEHPLHDAIPLRVLRRAAAQPTGLRGLPPAVPNQKQALPEL